MLFCYTPYIEVGQSEKEAEYAGDFEDPNAGEMTLSFLSSVCWPRIIHTLVDVFFSHFFFVDLGL